MVVGASGRITEPAHKLVVTDGKDELVNVTVQAHKMVDATAVVVETKTDGVILNDVCEAMLHLSKKRHRVL